MIVEEFVVQEYISGTVCSVVGKVVGGKVSIDLLYDIETDCHPYAAETGFYYPSRYQDTIEPELIKYCTEFIKEIGLDNSPFMLDVIVNDTGIWLIDFGARISSNAQWLIAVGGEIDYGIKIFDNIIHGIPYTMNISGAVLFRQLRIPKNSYNIICDKGHIAEFINLPKYVRFETINDGMVYLNPFVIVKGTDIVDAEYKFTDIAQSIRYS